MRRLGGLHPKPLGSGMGSGLATAVPMKLFHGGAASASPPGMTGEAPSSYAYLHAGHRTDGQFQRSAGGVRHQRSMKGTGRGGCARWTHRLGWTRSITKPSLPGCTSTVPRGDRCSPTGFRLRIRCTASIILSLTSGGRSARQYTPSAAAGLARLDPCVLACQQTSSSASSNMAGSIPCAVASSRHLATIVSSNA